MLLTAILFLPLILGVLTFLFVPANQTKYATLLNALITFALSVYAAFTFDWSGNFSTEYVIFGQSVTSVFQHHVHIAWPLFEQYKISYTLGVDSLGMIMVLLTTSLGILAVLCSFTSVQKRSEEFFFYLMVLQTGLLGVFMTLDLLLFFMAFEVMMLPMAFLIGIYGGENRLKAFMKFVVYSVVGSLSMFLTFIWIYYNGIQSFSLEAIMAADLGTEFQKELPFLGLMLAFLIKAPVWPFHTWLPVSYSESPTAGVVLSSIMLKAGVYGMLRFAIPLFPNPAVAFAPLICWLAVIGIIYCAYCAIAQTDVRRMIAYSSISHIGFIVLGIFCFNGLGVSGAIIQMVNHSISISGLFIVAGILQERRGTSNLNDFGGLAKNLPVLAALAMVMMLSAVGLPGLNGFVGEFPILVGALNNLPMLQQAQSSDSIYAIYWMTETTWVLGALAASGVILGAVYLLIMYQKIFFGRLDKTENIGLQDLNAREIFQLSVLAAAALILGLFPNLILSPIQSTTTSTLASVSPYIQLQTQEPADAFAALPADQ